MDNTCLTCCDKKESKVDQLMLAGCKNKTLVLICQTEFPDYRLYSVSQ